MVESSRQGYKVAYQNNTTTEHFTSHKRAASSKKLRATKKKPIATNSVPQQLRQMYSNVGAKGTSMPVYSFTQNGYMNTNGSAQAQQVASNQNQKVSHGQIQFDEALVSKTINHARDDTNGTVLSQNSRAGINN